MAYCTIKQLEDRLTPAILKLRIPETGSEKNRILQDYIKRASAFIDSRLAIKYKTPVANNKLLEDICLTIVLWQIEADRGTTGNVMPARIQIPYDEAMRTLNDLASGKINLLGSYSAGDNVAGLEVVSPTAYFNPDSPGMNRF